jgi:phthalate 4,5-dioxygenase oxygenase subunit
MLTFEENELLTRTGPGTPMGKLMRRYWIPALFSEQLPQPDCPPLRVRLLGEDLVAFRDTNGQPGMLGQHCPHRGASLFFGRNEECGLRCVYHGWKFDVTGQCVDMPNEPPESNFKTKIRTTAYPCVERGGVIWTYMGPPELQPGPPEYEFAMVPESHRFGTRHTQDCNWLQSVEGGLDTAHVPFLHIGDRAYDRGKEIDVKRDMKTIAFHYEAVDTDFGLMIGQRRHLDNERAQWSTTPYLLPWYKIIIPLTRDGLTGYHAWVPIDDEHCMTWSWEYHPQRPLIEGDLEFSNSFRHIHLENIPGTDRPVWNAGNDYGLDRELQRSGKHFTGIKGVGLQDTAMQESQGPIYDRRFERLGTSDVPLIAMRRCLLDALKHMERGEAPRGLDPASHHARPGNVILPIGAPFAEGLARLSGSAADWAPVGIG